MFLRPNFSLRAVAEPWPCINHFERVARAFDNFVDDAHWSTAIVNARSTSSSRFEPRASGGVLSIEMPGVDPASLELMAQGRELIVQASPAKTSVFPEESYVRRERQSSGLREKFHFDFPIDFERTLASFVDGVLKVELARVDDQSPKKISVSVH